MQQNSQRVLDSHGFPPQSIEVGNFGGKLNGAKLTGVQRLICVCSFAVVWRTYGKQHRSLPKGTRGGSKVYENTKTGMRILFTEGIHPSLGKHERTEGTGKLADTSDTCQQNLTVPSKGVVLQACKLYSMSKFILVSVKSLCGV